MALCLLECTSNIAQSFWNAKLNCKNTAITLLSESFLMFTVHTMYVLAVRQMVYVLIENSIKNNTFPLCMELEGSLA